MNFVPSGFFAIRTPLLSFDELIAWSDGLAAPAAWGDPTRLEQALAADRSRLRAALVAAVARPEVREALFVASPNLEASLDVWARDPDSTRGRGIELAITRYFLRMAGRSTPFGLCAGCAVGTIGSKTRLVHDARDQWKRHTRLDMDYLSAMTDIVARDPTAQRAFLYRPNSTLYRAAGRIRYVESLFRGKERTYSLVAVEDTDGLQPMLARARDGATITELVACLVDTVIAVDEAEEFIASLIENQVLVPDMALPVTGSQPIHALIDQFSKDAALAPIAETLAEVRAALVALDANGIGNPPERYRVLFRLLHQLPANVDVSRMVQVDMIKPTREMTLGEPVLVEIVRGVNVLHRLARGPVDDADELARFRRAFASRYEERFVPLVEALDAETGIGFPASRGTGGTEGEASPLLEGLGGPSEPDRNAQWEARERLLLRKLGDALLQGRLEIVFDEREFDEIAVLPPRPLPDAFAVTATVAATSDVAVAAGDFRIVFGGGRGPSGAALLGRFCHADSTLLEHVRQHLQAEEALRPDAIFAEIVHLPEGRLGNILARPVLRGYEIPYLGRSGASADRQIAVTDLHLAVRGDRVIVYSARLAREVIPRLTSAHNFAGRNLPVYQFLCAIQGQGTASLGWDWGVLRDAPFLPRVTTGRVVLSRARWRAWREELRSLGQQPGAARYRAVQQWRAARRLPRLVALADGDNELPLDLDNVLCVDVLVDRIKDRDEATLVEVFPTPNLLLASGPEGRYAHELVVPFVRAKPAPEQPAARKVPALRPNCTRTFPPGSEWLFAKLYTGTATADQVLRELVAPLVTKVLGSGAADSWFFIRYYVSQWHIRWRLHGSKERLIAEVLPAVHAAAAPLLDDGRIWRVQLDTYEREIERYGGPEGIVLVETIFQADSEAVLDILAGLEPDDAGLDERWRLTLRGIDMLLADFGFDLQTKYEIAEQARARAAGAVRADGRLRGQIGDRFRKERESLESLLDSSHDATSPLAPGLDALHERSARLAPLVVALQAREGAGALTTPLRDMAASLIHMHANRLLRSAVRAHELVIYDFLARLYDAQLARSKYVRDGS